MLTAMEEPFSEHLIREHSGLNQRMAGPHAHPRMRDFLARQLQSPEGERELGASVEKFKG